MLTTKPGFKQNMFHIKLCLPKVLTKTNRVQIKQSKKTCKSFSKKNKNKNKKKTSNKKIVKIKTSKVFRKKLN